MGVYIHMHKHMHTNYKLIYNTTISYMPLFTNRLHSIFFFLFFFIFNLHTINSLFIVYSSEFDKHVVMCPSPHSSECFHHPSKLSHAAVLFSVPLSTSIQPLATSDLFFDPYSFAFSRMSHK